MLLLVVLPLYIMFPETSQLELPKIFEYPEPTENVFSLPAIKQVLEGVIFKVVKQGSSGTVISHFFVKAGFLLLPVYTSIVRVSVEGFSAVTLIDGPDPVIEMFLLFDIVHSYLSFIGLPSESSQGGSKEIPTDAVFPFNKVSGQLDISKVLDSEVVAGVQTSSVSFPFIVPLYD